MGMKFKNPVPAIPGLLPNCGSAVAGFKRGIKKAAGLAGLLLGMAVAASAIPVTYQANMGTQIALGNFHPGVDTVFVSGTFSSPQWEDTASDGANSYLLTPVAGNTNLYTGTFSVSASSGTLESYKFVINPGGNFSALYWELPVSTAGGNRSFIVPGVATNLPVVYFNDQALPAATPFVAGADFSDLSFFEARNVTYKEGGTNQDGIQILKDHGINCVRLRLWTGTDAMVATNNPYNYTNNLSYTVPLAVRVKNAGLQFMLDFHYSDTWADPGAQATPAAWTNLNFTQLVQQMRTYNSNTITAFEAAGAMPDYVQIGNEITDGILWTNGELEGTWSSSNPSWIRLGQLMNAAIQGIQDATNATGAKMPKIIVHIDRGGDWATTESFFDNLNAQGVTVRHHRRELLSVLAWSVEQCGQLPDQCGQTLCQTRDRRRDRLSLDQLLLDNKHLRHSGHHERPGSVSGCAGPGGKECARPGWGPAFFGGGPNTSRQRRERSRLQYRVVFRFRRQRVAGGGCFRADGRPGHVEPQPDGLRQSDTAMAVERGGNDTDDGNQFDVAGGLAAGAEHRPKHRNWFTVTLPVDSSQSRFYRLQSN